MAALCSYVHACDCGGACAGPFNLGTTHHVCTILKNLLKNPDFANTKIIYYCFVESSDITNAIYLLGAFLCIYMGATPEQAWLPFRKLNSSLSLPYRDATWVKSTYDLHLTDCWAGIRRALDSNIYRPETFDKNEYLYYDDPNNGDLHEVMAGKFIAFKGPRAKRIELVNGSFTMLPSDYVEVFRAKNVTCVVRLNNPEYDKRDFEDAGFTHHDLFFTDCSTPPDELVDRFLHIAEGASGIVAVHCLAGLGRTGTLIGLYMMKHNGFTAREVMAWLRISRPGSIIGPQQHYLEEQEERMRQLGRQGVAGLGGAIRRSPVSSGRNSPKSLADRESSVAAKQKANGKSAVLADMVTDGMMNRDRARLQAFTKTAAQATPSHKSRLNSELRRTSSALDMGNPANTEAGPAGAASDGDKLPAINKGASKATSAVSGGRVPGAPTPAQAAKSGAAAKPAGFAARIKSLAGGTFKEKPSLAKKEAAKTDGGTSGLSNLVRTGTY